jgi:hypothetical protein
LWQDDAKVVEQAPEGQGDLLANIIRLSELRSRRQLFVLSISRSILREDRQQAALARDGPIRLVIIAKGSGQTPVE